VLDAMHNVGSRSLARFSLQIFARAIRAFYSRRYSPFINVQLIICVYTLLHIKRANIRNVARDGYDTRRYDTVLSRGEFLRAEIALIMPANSNRLASFASINAIDQFYLRNIALTRGLLCV